MATAIQVKHSKRDHIEINQGLTIVYPDPDAPKKSSNEEIAVDIIAVPGLGASPEWTWKSKNKVNWLSDGNMLPRTVTNARIMVFEYESQWFGKGSINQRLSSVADQLVQALATQRSRGSKRPIVFVCHCLGGIIVEKALLSAQLRQLDYPNLFMSVVGCVFLGTPFRGTKSQSKATLLAEMAETVGLGTNSGLLRLLEEGSEMLKDLLSDFSALARESNIQIFCFFEQHASDLVNLVFKGTHPKHKELVVDEDSAHIDGYRKGALAADHFELNKFTGPKDGRYISVSGEIKAAVQKAPGILKSRQNLIRQTLVDDATYQTILDDLKATDPRKDLQDSLRGRPVNQASWVLSNDKFMKWQEAKASQVLWIHGDAGKGQPVIASSIMKHLEDQIGRAEETFLAYFFCDEKDSHRRTIRDVLRLLIRQMILKNRDLVEHLLVEEGTGKSGGRKPQNFETVPLAALWGSLQNMLSDASVEKVYFIVNAFDETDKDSRKELFTLMAPYLLPQTGDMAEDETVVKWIILSRSGRPDIEKSLSKGLIICIEDKENAGFVNDGVKREISGQVDELAKLRYFNDALTYLIKRYIFAKADGNYIYAHLVVQELKNLEPSQTNISTIRKLLEDLPYGLTDMFEFVRQRVLNPKREGIEYTKEILRCLIIAEESPTLHELALIADLPYEDRNDMEALHRYIRKCGAFLTTTVNENGFDIVEWIDVCAKEHLNTYAKEELSLDLNDVQHGIISLRCLEHVRRYFAAPPDEQDRDILPSVQDDPAPDAIQDGDTGADDTGESDLEGDASDAQSDTAATEPENQAADAVTEPAGCEDDAQSDGASVAPAAEPDTPQTFVPFLGYATDYWLSHAKEAPVDLVEEFNLEDKFWIEDSSVRGNWWTEYSQNTRHAGVSDISPLHLAALTGFISLTGHLLEHGRAEELHKADSRGYTPLSRACDYGDVTLVNRLLKAGADINHPPENGGPSSLWAAASSSHTEIVQHLIERGAQVNWTIESRGSPLYTAASMNSIDIVRELLQHGADVNLKGGSHLRPLNIAAYSGYLEIVQMLLDRGIEVNPDEDYRYGSALGAAARAGHAEIVRLLLKKGWNVNQKIKTYISPLVAASTHGHADVVQALLEAGAEGTSQIQALEIGSKNGRADVVKNLLDHTPYLPHKKAFHLAATQGRDDVLELLEKRGTSSEMLSTALYDASDGERESTVNLLLKFGADPNAEGKEYKAFPNIDHPKLMSIHRYGNALQAAAFDGSLGIIESLLAHNVDVNKQGGDYGTALQAAALYGHEDIARKLLDHGAHVNTSQPVGRYGSALQAAACSQSSELIQLLIDHGADVNAYGGLYGSAIMAAVDESMQINMEILVKHGANVHVKDARDERAPVLVMAGYRLGKQYLEMLLDHGADMEAVDDENTTVLIAAADSGDKESVEWLLSKGANIHHVSTSLGTALSAAASEGDEECLRVLLDHGGDPNAACGDWGTALYAAAEAADLDCINMLLEAGADVNQGDSEHGYPLQSAATSGDTVCLQRLLEAGADVHLGGGDTGSVVTAAVKAGHLELLNILLEHSADVNMQGGIWQCALQAACARQNNYDCVKTLLDHGADVHVYGGLYGSVMQAAAFGQNLDLVDLLLEHGAEIDAQGGKYGNALQAAALKAGKDFVQRLLDLHAEVNKASGKYGTALQAAAFSSDAETVALLLEHHTNPQLEGGLYGNALNAAARHADADVVNHLLEQTLPYSMLDGALLQAVLFRQDETVNSLLKKGASVKARDDELGSPLELLQKAPGEDNNSDFSGDEEDEESDMPDDEDEDEDGDEDIDDDDGESSVGAGTDNGASIADLQLEDPSTTESKIQKYLEGAKTKIRRNPTLRRPAAIQRKPVGQSQGAPQLPSSTAQYDVYGASKPQLSEQVSSAYQSLSSHWRKNSVPRNDISYQGAGSSQQASAPTSNGYAACGASPPATQAYNSYNSYAQPTLLSATNTYHVGSPSQLPLSPYQAQGPYDNPAPPPRQPPQQVPSYQDKPLPSILRPSISSQNLNNTTSPPPPAPPPRPQPTSNGYQSYSQPSPYQSPSQAYHSPTQQHYQSSPQPQQTYFPPQQQQQSQYQSPPAQQQAPYSSYPPQPIPSSHQQHQPPQPQHQTSYSGGAPYGGGLNQAQPLAQPPRPQNAQQGQSSDSIDFDRLQQKAQKFAGRFGWK